MHLPRATYRLQFNPQFTFRAARHIVPYLAELGISDVYASPIFRARSGSQHGYDVVNPTRLNPEVGSDADFEELIQAVKDQGMGWIQDVVPNHMAYSDENYWLMDVLENGPDSEYYHFFDIEWQHPYENIRGKILSPFLGDFYGECLERGEITLKYRQDGLRVNYYAYQFPLRIDSYFKVLAHDLGRLKRTLGGTHGDYIKLLGVLFVLKNLPTREEPAERREQILFVKRMLWELYSDNAQVRQFVDRNLEIFNGKPGDPSSFDLLDSLLAEQFFRLAFWKVGTEEVNYRRFFYVNDLILLRTTDLSIFPKTHALILRLAQERKIQGLRIDHVDGLYDPTDYLRVVRDAFGDLYITVEKILELTEDLPVIWPIQGSTGYEFMNYVNGVFVQKENENPVTRTYQDFTGYSRNFDEALYDKKRLIIRKYMRGDIDNLAHVLATVARRHRYGSDYTLNGLRSALVEILAMFPVYRTYIRPGESSEADHAYIRETVEKAKKLLPDFTHELDFIRAMLLLEGSESLTEEEKSQWLFFTMRFQQITGPLMAKGFEDTLLYDYVRFLSLNEVGGSPNIFGLSLIQFHYFMKKRASQWLHSMSATSTHDTKRGEDVRARMNVLSEIPEDWDRMVRVWHKIGQEYLETAGAQQYPTRNDEYFLYQTLVGAWPFSESEQHTFRQRIKEYAVKAVREGKVNSTWMKPDEEYESAYLKFIDGLLTDDPGNPFLKEFLPFQRKVAWYGMYNSLAQALIKMAAPGVPDFYQGSELWDLSLVDPDNRRPVDYERRRSALNNLIARDAADRPGLIRDLFDHPGDGRIKQFLIYRALQARRDYRDLFDQGAYGPLKVSGKHRERVIAFARNYGDRWAVCLAPRFLAGLIREGEFPFGEVWEDTEVELPDDSASWREVITEATFPGGESLRLSEVFQLFPAGLLVSGGK
ncbi:MAG: malto-oligosyltrehalose synthase [Candidatus Zixiibacteriota bacterium]|nr:MAG: malto-oligosyltrehalose synthase [candidate division Zixibacteria bacterium]